MSGPGTQRGAATLVVAMGLLLGATTWVLTAVRAHWLQARVNRHEIEAVRERTQLESGLAVAIERLALEYRTWNWRPDGSAGEQRFEFAVTPAEFVTELAGKPPLSVLATRAERSPNLVRMRVSSGNGADALVERVVRPFSILSPAGEVAPPLVIDGCIGEVRGRPDLYPATLRDTRAAAAIWSSAPVDCVGGAGLDVHGGTLSGGRFTRGTLWRFLFAVERDEFERLAILDRDRSRDVGDRHYWLARRNDLVAGRWSTSIGSPGQPAALVFPAALGCPPIVPGTRIVGIVVYEGDCAAQGALGGHLYGTLAVAGNLGGYDKPLKLAHVSRLEPAVRELRFPVLSVVPVPGTWRDYP